MCYNIMLWNITDIVNCLRYLVASWILFSTATYSESMLRLFISKSLIRLATNCGVARGCHFANSIGKFITRRGNSTLNCTRKPISHESRNDECDIGFQVQFNVEFTSQVMNFP